MTPLPRLTCPVCVASVAVRRGGELREHPDHRHELYGVPGAVRDGRVPMCVASGLTLAQVGTKIDSEIDWLRSKSR